MKEKKELPSFDAMLKGFKVKLQVEGLLLGSVPDKIDTLKYYNEAEPKRPEELQVKADDLPMPSKDEEIPQEERSRCVFRRRDDKICIDEHIIKGAIKNAFKLMSKIDSKNRRGMWMDFFTEPKIIPIQYNGDGIREEVRCFNGFTMQGMRSFVSMHEAVLNPTLEFTLTCMNDKFTVEHVKQLMDFAGRYCGLGAGRLKEGKDYGYGLFKCVECTE